MSRAKEAVPLLGQRRRLFNDVFFGLSAGEKRHCRCIFGGLGPNILLYMSDVRVNSQDGVLRRCVMDERWELVSMGEIELENI